MSRKLFKPQAVPRGHTLLPFFKYTLARSLTMLLGNQGYSAGQWPGVHTICRNVYRVGGALICIIESELDPTAH